MKKRYWIVNKVNSFTAEILLYGFIGEHEAIDDAAFITDLRKLESEFSTINIRVNCGGGDVYKGLAIFNAIRNSRSQINGFVDGIAASMGAVVIAACHTVQMSKYARYMTHRAMGGAFGNADDMRSFATQLDELENIIAAILAKRTGLTTEAAKEKYIVNIDRWISAEQALNEKLIDAIYDADPVQLPGNMVSQQQLFNAYHKVYNISTINESNMKAVAQLLGLDENATEVDFVNAINKIKGDLTTAKNAVSAMVKARAKKLIDTAILNRQLVEADRASFEPMAENNFEATEAVIARLPGQKKPGEFIRQSSASLSNADDAVETWEDLCKKDDAFIADFKKTEPGKYNELLNAYLKTPVKN